MRVMAIVTLALVALSGAGYAQEPAVVVIAPEIPAPPGGELVTEINLSENDILGMIKQAIPAFAQAAASTPGGIGNFLRNVDFTTLSEAISGVKAVRMVQFQMGPTVQPEGILSFYAGQLPASEGWSRILYDTSTTGKGSLAVYARNAEGLFAVGVHAKKNRVFAIRTVGMVDVAKLAAWAGKTITSVAEMHKTKAPEPEPATK